MIFYFTGTGNSLDVAQRLAALTGTGICSIAEIMKGKTMPALDEVTGIVYPIYAWAPPRIVRKFLEQHSIKSKYVYSVCTCGEDAGHAVKKVEKSLGGKLDSAWSIAMPNNYILGMDVDSPEERDQMLAAAAEKIAVVAEAVNQRECGIYDVHEGAKAGFKSGVVAPFFSTFATSAKFFYAEDSCIGCKKCEAVCPTQNIIVDGKPQWGKECTSCLACLHHCPVQAIQRGKETVNKGRYINPNCQVTYDFTK